MKRKAVIILTAGYIMSSLSLIGCGRNTEDAVEDVMVDVPVEEATEIIMETKTEIQTEIQELVEETETNTEEFLIKETYTEKGDLLLLDGSFNLGTQVDMSSWDIVNEEYDLDKSISIYYTDISFAGYTKDNAKIITSLTNGEWYFCIFDRSGYLVKAEDLMSAVADNKEQEIVSDKSAKESAKEATVQPVEEPVVHTDDSVLAVEPEPEPEPEPPVVVESTKYTPEEAIAVYRSIMESNGIRWEPSLKGNWDETIGMYDIDEWYDHDDNYFGGSWGTGWIYLDKGYPERIGYGSVESYRIGNHGGNSWDCYYLEVTGSDENSVYVTEWHP